MSIAKDYIDGLKEAYIENGGQELLEEFENTIHGISKEDKEALKELYPEIPESLLELLDFVDGTYFREYGVEKVLFYFLGSDVSDGEYPYYLLSAKNIIENIDVAVQYYGDYIDLPEVDEDGEVLEDYEVEVDERILRDSEETRWIHFSDCMNNGGTSQLFIDLSPSESGKVGQIIRTLHDPDEIVVIADSFDEYLQDLIDSEYFFIDEDGLEIM